MKKAVTLLLMLSLTILPARAQREGTQDIALTWGVVSLPQTAYLLGDLFGVIFTAGHFNPQNTRFTGAFGAEYTYWVNTWLGVGGDMTFDHMNSDILDEKTNEITGHYRMTAYSLMPSAKASWFNHEKVGMYSKVSAGAALFDTNGDDSPTVTFAFQVSPVCVDFGGKHLRGIVNIGYGFQGLVIVGLKYTL